jgi:plastocyanin
MSIPPRVLVLLVPFALAIACGRSAVSPSPEPTVSTGQPAAAAASSASSSAPAAHSLKGRLDVLVSMHDACDPDTFNAAVGAGTCTRAGGLQFDKFIAELTRLGTVGAWHFAPPNANVQVGQTFAVVNRGGEVHTFTEVAQFGGGIVPSLNDLAHVPAVAPECTALEDDDFVPPGGTYREEIDEAGPAKYQCCIHPWMRLESRAASR